MIQKQVLCDTMIKFTLFDLEIVIEKLNHIVIRQEG